ncbi:serine dehydratase beta chain [Gorillibacterium timonense]|uniref:serine dehydratase beta chain n=1 Tax=Gorillibacterium timonense TaxID=1689269 RepID=UPI00071C80BE|nr:serine dehydratase beta chain [Gorillibacterium timonense]
MRFKDVFSIIGPAMVGPSSSHTAGAARIGRAARHLYGRDRLPAKAEIVLYGSFADTYKGHGTDMAIVGGLLDFATDDERLPRAQDIARMRGMDVAFIPGKGLHPHPNTATIRLYAPLAENTGAAAESDEQTIRLGTDEESSPVTPKPEPSLVMTGTSIGGGNIEVVSVNGFNVRFSGVYPALVITHNDSPGVIADITQILKREWVNIGYMSVDRKSRAGDAMMVLELDAMIPESLIEELAGFPSIREIRSVELS